MSSATDAYNAIQRLQALYESEIQTDHKDVNESLPVAIRVEHADFTWDAPPPVPEEAKSKKGKKKAQAAPTADTSGTTTPKEEKIFKLSDITFDIPRGQLVAVVGPVGSGKSSLLQGLIGGEW